MKFYCDTKRHLVCLPYSEENLHIMACLLKIKKCWFHRGKHPHYDIPVRRYHEIRRRCTLLTEKHILKIITGEIIKI